MNKKNIIPNILIFLISFFLFAPTTILAKTTDFFEDPLTTVNYIDWLNFYDLITVEELLPADDNKENKGPPKKGNFILPGSQQPGPLVSFGENIVDKNTTQLFLAVADLEGPDKQMVEAIPGILYGVTDDFSIFFNVPLAVSFTENQQHSSGVGDLFLQFEYAFYSQETTQYTEQATVVGNITFPTGDSHEQPPIGLGSSSFLLGGTYNRTYEHWLFFTSQGVVLTTVADNMQPGDQILYQCGMGRNIFNIDTSWIFAAIMEATGQYTAKTKIANTPDPDSGGNVVFITPSLWLSSKHLTLQAGLGMPAVQNLNGNQAKASYLAVINLGWTL